MVTEIKSPGIMAGAVSCNMYVHCGNNAQAPKKERDNLAEFD